VRWEDTSQGTGSRSRPPAPASCPAREPAAGATARTGVAGDGSVARGLRGTRLPSALPGDGSSSEMLGVKWSRKCLLHHVARISAKWPYYDNCAKLWLMEISCLFEEIAGARVTRAGWGTAAGRRGQGQRGMPGRLPGLFPQRWPSPQSWELQHPQPVALGLGRGVARGHWVRDGACVTRTWPHPAP